MAQRYSSRLTSKTPRVADIVSFRFDKPPGYEYVPGQWFVVEFTDATGTHGHHFSHSNSPNDLELEFTTRLRGTEFKNALDDLPIGARVELEGPYGGFTLAQNVDRVALVTAGIGITAVRSILLWLADDRGQRADPPGSIVLLFANRSEEGIPFRDELADLGGRLPLRVVHIISNPGENWEGYRGHIDAEILDRELSRPAGWTCYVCGPLGFVRSMREVLTAWGVEPSSLRLENFDGYE